MTSIARSYGFVGAGVVGQVYAGRLAQAGCDVWLLARGSTLEQLRSDGMRLIRDGQRTSPPVKVVADPAEMPPVDVAVLAVRADQVPGAAPSVHRIQARSVLTLVNLAGEAPAVADELGSDRTIFGFSGVGGTRDEAGVTYHQIDQQHTTIGVAEGRGQDLVHDLERAQFTVDQVEDPIAWLATHAVFIAGIGAGILRAGGSAELGRSRRGTGEMILSVRDGFSALARRGTTVTPGPLKVIFTRVPRLISVPYWQKQLRGDLGCLALAPHVLSTRETEFPWLVDQARALTGPTGAFDQALTGAGFPPRSSVAERES